MGTFQEYCIDDKDVSEWLSWGGLVHKNVLKNKDGSMLGVLEYTPLSSSDNKKIGNREYLNGWSFWFEKQHDMVQDRFFMVVCWNPFFNSDHKAENTIGHILVSEHKLIPYFANELQHFADSISFATDCKVLEYQGILDFLFFSLSFNNSDCPIMPDVPLYIDALLSQDLDIKFEENDILIQGKRLLALTLPDIPDDATMETLYKAFTKLSYRYVRRILCFSEEEATQEFDRYTNKWCSGRKSIMKAINNGILSHINGYYSNCFFFLLDKDEYEKIVSYCEKVMDILQRVYIIESYNLKDIWWGSLAGLFRANITDPIMGFDSIDELLCHQEEKKEAPADV